MTPVGALTLTIFLTVLGILGAIGAEAFVIGFLVYLWKEDDYVFFGIVTILWIFVNCFCAALLAQQLGRI